MEIETKLSPLAEYRRLRGLSQMALASKLGLKGSGTISKWENWRIPAECVLRVSQVTGIAPHILRPDIYPKPKRGRAA
jgi:hypothetical protein